MKLYYNSIFFLLFLFIVGCSSTSETSINDIKFLSSSSTPKNITSTNIEITIPYNWIEIKDNNNSIFEIWLINNKANAVIAFIPINLNTELNLDDLSTKLTTIEEMLIFKKKNSGHAFSIIEEEFLSSNYQMRSIKYLIDDELQNSIIFGNNERFYECLTYFSKEYKPSNEDIEELFETQKQIVDDVIFK